MLVNTAPRRWISQTQPTVPMPLEKIPSTTVTISGVSGGGIAGGPSSASAPRVANTAPVRHIISPPVRELTRGACGPSPTAHREAETAKAHRG